jgi:[ribosomal protein S5]-alanine N-acetyltransferase
MNQVPTLKGFYLILRQPRPEDIEDRFHCGRHAEIIRMYGGDTRNMTPYTREGAQAWFNKMIRSPAFEWAVEFNGRCIGQARLTVSEPDKRARYAVGLFDISKLGQGLGTKITRVILDYAFNTLKLHRVDLRILEYNKRAIACYQKCGFIIEGMEREGALIEDKWETDILMSILQHEYQKTCGNSSSPKH